MKNKTNLKVQLRKLWEERAELERLALLSIQDEINNVSSIQKELRRNSEGIGKAMGEYFKNLVGSRVSNPEEYCKYLMQKGNMLTPDEKRWMVQFTVGNIITIMLKHSAMYFIDYVAAIKEGNKEKINNARYYWANTEYSIDGFFHTPNPKFKGLDVAFERYVRTQRKLLKTIEVSRRDNQVKG